MKIGDAFPSDYLKAADLNGKSIRVTIDTVTLEKMGDEQKAIVHFVGKDKGLVLNKTNANRIVEAVGSEETDDWRGWSFVLYSTKVDYQGKRVDAIRIDDRPGAAKAPATPARRAPVVEDIDDAPPIDESDIPF